MCVSIAFPYAAVETVIFTIVGKFDQSAHVDVVSVIAVALFACQGKEIFGKFRSASLDQCDPFFFGKCMFCLLYTSDAADEL